MKNCVSYNTVKKLGEVLGKNEGKWTRKVEIRLGRNSWHNETGKHTGPPPHFLQSKTKSFTTLTALKASVMAFKTINMSVAVHFLS